MAGVHVKNTFLEVDDIDVFEEYARPQRQISEPAPKSYKNEYNGIHFASAESADYEDSESDFQRQTSTQDSLDPKQQSSSNSTDEWEGVEESSRWGRFVTGDGWDCDSREEPSVAVTHERAPTCYQQGGLQSMTASQFQMQQNCPQVQVQKTPWSTSAAAYDEKPTFDSDGVTVMVRNLPNKYTQSLLLDEVYKKGFQGSFDFFYLPIDPETGANKGYAFMNFINEQWAQTFTKSFSGRKMEQFSSSKRIEVTPAVLQGFRANYLHYSQSHVNNGAHANMRPLFMLKPCADPNIFALPKPTKPLSCVASSGNRFRRAGKGSLIDQAAKQQEDQTLGGCLLVSTSLEQQGAPMISVADNYAPPNPSAGGVKAVNFCPFCGKKVNTAFKFCHMCGKDLQVFKARN